MCRVRLLQGSGSATKSPHWFCFSLGEKMIPTACPADLNTVNGDRAHLRNDLVNLIFAARSSAASAQVIAINPEHIVHGFRTDRAGARRRRAMVFPGGFEQKVRVTHLFCGDSASLIVPQHHAALPLMGHFGGEAEHAEVV